MIAQLGNLAIRLEAEFGGTCANGCKFDEIIVLEGREGLNKSNLIELMAGAENFSDQSILAADDRKQQKQMGGVWLYEIADLTGIRSAEVEKIKAFASRQYGCRQRSIRLHLSIQAAEAN